MTKRKTNPVKHTRKEMAMVYRRLKLAEVWSQDVNQTQAQIRTRLKEEHDLDLKPMTISRDMKWLKNHYWSLTEETMQLIRGVIFEQYMKVIQESEFAWRLSLDNKESTTTDPDGKTTDKVEGQSGNPGHQGNIIKALTELRTLLGLDAAKELRLTGLPVVYKDTMINLNNESVEDS